MRANAALAAARLRRAGVPNVAYLGIA